MWLIWKWRKTKDSFSEIKTEINQQVKNGRVWNRRFWVKVEGLAWLNWIVKNWRLVLFGARIFIFFRPFTFIPFDRPLLTWCGFGILQVHGQHHIRDDQIVVRIVAECHHQRNERVINYLPAVVVLLLNDEKAHFEIHREREYHMFTQKGWFFGEFVKRKTWDLKRTLCWNKWDRHEGFKYTFVLEFKIVRIHCETSIGYKYQKSRHEF